MIFTGTDFVMIYFWIYDVGRLYSWQITLTTTVKKTEKTEGREMFGLKKTGEEKYRL